MYEPGSHLVSSGALATLSGAKTGRTPKDKRVVREPGTEADIWCANAPDALAAAVKLVILLLCLPVRRRCSSVPVLTFLFCIRRQQRQGKQC